MHKKGVIEYSEVKGVGHKLITQVFRDNKEFKQYIPKLSLRKTKKELPVLAKNEESSIGYPKIQIVEGY